ncbi:Small nuclear ribonucleoprotein-associated protein B (snRNP-B) (Sm protein B) (Sm-B) (SmB) [Durusdinium trenchii]|uniref:Sm protein B n=1 Tax=Durusdinium trenchii TaxID=1381693 RepID=A0ABP0KMT5_9DINO
MGKVRAVRRKLAQFFNWRVSVTLTDGRVLVGVLMAVDRHVNIVLCNTEEYRKYKVKGKPEGKELKRMLGFIVVRGTGILYIQPEELGKEDLVETDKPRKKAQAPQAAPAKPAAPKPAAPSAGATMNPAAALLAGMRAPLVNPLLAAGLRPGGLPGLPSMPGMPSMPSMGMPNMAMPGAGRGMAMPGMPTMRPM